MPEASDGNSPPQGGAQGGASAGEEGSRRRRNNNNNRARNQQAQVREAKFEGDEEALSGHVYDVTNDGKSYAKTTEKIAEYVAKSYKGAGEFRRAIIDGEFTVLNPPTPPADADANNRILVNAYERAMTRHEKKVDSREMNAAKAYSLVCGQCSSALRTRMEAHPDWAAVDQQDDLMGLLRIIKFCMVRRETRRYDIAVIQESTTKVMNFKQRPKMTSHEFYRRFKDLVDEAEAIGATFGYSPNQIAIELAGLAVDAQAPTDAEREAAQEAVKQKFLAMVFLGNCHKPRYGDYIDGLKIDRLKGNNTYPTTLVGAYEFISGCPAKGSTPQRDEGGLAYYQNQEQDADGGQWQQVQRGGRGRGRGSGRDGGRGRSSG